jgi:hypothetical protein
MQMAHPLTEFLLSLTDAGTFNQYSKANETGREAMMSAAGLSSTQIGAVIHKNIPLIVEMVEEELYPHGDHRAARIIHLQIAIELPADR